MSQGILISYELFKQYCNRRSGNICLSGLEIEGRVLKCFKDECYMVKKSASKLEEAKNITSTNKQSESCYYCCDKKYLNLKGLGNVVCPACKREL